MNLPAIRSAVKPEEAALLTRYARNRTVLEVGSQFGFSTVVMARVATMVHAVDWHRGDPHSGRHDSLPRLWANLAHHGVLDRVVLHVGRSDTILPLFRPASFGFAFHDSYHATDAVLADAALMLPLVEPGALCAFHDYGKPKYGVTQAVDALGLERVALTRSLVVVRVPEAMAA